MSECCTSVLSLASHPSTYVHAGFAALFVTFLLLFVLCSLLSPFLCTHVWLYNTWARQLSYQRTSVLFPTVFTVQSQVCLLAHQFLNFTCFIYVMPNLYALCRSCFLACICYCYTCSHRWQSGCDNRHIFNNQTMPCSWMLPTSQSSPYFKTWTYVYPGDQLDPDDPDSCNNYRFPGHNFDWKCLR